MISKTGTYRGIVTDNGIAKSSGGFAQFNLNLLATEYYDLQEQEWVDWSEQNEEILAFLMLYGKDPKKALFHVKSVQEVFGWSGQGFKELNNPAYVDVQLQFTVEENEYNNNITLQVSRIAKYDAIPGRGVQKANDTEIKELEAKYAQGLKALGGTKIASAPKPTGKPALPIATETTDTDKTKPDLPNIPGGNIPDEPELPKLPETSTMPGGGKCTKIEAWRDVVAKKLESAPDLADEKLSAIWTDAIQKIAPNAKKGNLTQIQWYEVRREVIAILEIGF